jgi:undecaprenyl-diphosphatase
VWAIVLGVVQGLTEFLPISSSGHLALLPWIFGIKDPVLSSLSFDVALHAGSAVAILIALWSDWMEILRSVIGRPRPQRTSHRDTAPADLELDPMREPKFARLFLGFLLLTSVPGAVFGVLFESKAETIFRNPVNVAVQLIVFGILLWAVDKYVRRAEPIGQMNWWKSLTIGFAQALALMPGVSRSGATITTGRALGFSREAAAKYSFMAALPIIAGAAVFKLKDVPVGELLSMTWILGFLAAVISSVLAMRWMLGYVRKHSYAVFMWYRIVFGVLVLWIALYRS